MHTLMIQLKQYVIAKDSDAIWGKMNFAVKDRKDGDTK